MDTDAWAEQLARRKARARSVAAGVAAVPVLFALTALIGPLSSPTLWTCLWVAVGLALGAWRRDHPLAAGAGALVALGGFTLVGIVRSDDGTAAAALFILPFVSPMILAVIALGAFAAGRFRA